MDKTERNKLRNIVNQCRLLLEKDIGEQLEGHFGIHLRGEIESSESMTHLSESEKAQREELLSYLQHLEAQGLGRTDAVARLVREVAYTHLNRLVAFKMMEHPSRKLIPEAVGRGIKSRGFIFYLAEHPDDERLHDSGQQDLAYRHFLEWLSQTHAEEISALFSPHDPANRLFPRRRVLEAVLALLNGEGENHQGQESRTALDDIWQENETIGWVYQYFTPKEVREKVRAESSAPRNSYELAFRNQFYTPRYVVQFLVDNTLGRFWYEMRPGETELKDSCRYLVWGNGRSSEREKKDPREIKILDPACGSGHFLLYAFDLLVKIYLEAWASCKDDQLTAAPKFKETRRTICQDYPEEQLLKKALPDLILRYNLFGIDIDPRATQIAALALWLRAQQAYQDFGFKPVERPKITRANIVCAEPMPGDKKMLEEFVAGLKPIALREMVRKIFEKMLLASEVGSLLKIEEEIKDVVAQTKKRWQSEYKNEQWEQLSLWPKQTPSREQMSLFDAYAIPDEDFWQGAEGKVVDALRRYAEGVANGRSYQRRLFTEDTVQGFSFIDVLRQKYDVILMNPPFGETSKPSKGYIDEKYPLTKNDVYAAFVERGLQLLHPGGFLGAITSRTGFFLSSFQRWREEIVLKKARPLLVADLGAGVLDTAMVETAAYVLEARK